MPIRIKISLFVLLAIALYWFASEFLISRNVYSLADELEKDASMRQVVRVQQEVTQWQTNTDLFCREWVSHLRMLTPEENPSLWLKDHLGTALEMHNLQFAAIFSDDGKIVNVLQRLAGGRVREDGQKQEIQTIQTAYDATEDLKDATSGFLYTSSNVIVFAAQRIPTGIFANKLLVVGMTVNDARQKEMRETTHVDGARIVPLSPEAADKLKQKTPGNDLRPWLGPLAKSDTSLSGFSLIRDLKGQPVGLIEVTQPRRLAQLTANDLRQLFGILSVIAITLAVLTILVMDFFVTGRISRLAKAVSDASPDTLRKLPRSYFRSRDEVGVIAKTARTMVERLYDSQSRYRAVVETQTELIMRCTPDGELTFVNDAFAEFFGSTLSSFKGRNYFSFLPEEMREPEEEQMKRLNRRERSLKRELCLTASDGAVHWLEWNLRAIFDEKGTLTEIQAVGWDITERRKSGEELKLAKEEAEAADRAKSEFLAVISHEIRTPLNSIMGFSSLVQQLITEETAKESLQQIQESSSLLLRIFDDIFEFASMESQQQKLNESELSLRDCVISAMAHSRREAEEKELKYEMDIAPEAPEIVITDPQRVQRIFHILISNAVKFTQRGIVKVYVGAQAGESADHPTLIIEVADTGIGMSPEVKQNLFTPFLQADSSTTRIYGGLGLGLAICKRIATLMGGKVAVQSELGKGSVFRVTIPVRIPANVAA